MKISLCGLQEEVNTFAVETMGLATKPAERKVWWRIPTRGPWQELDLRKYFTNA